MQNIEYNQGPPDPTPEQRLFMLNDDSWESFIFNCANQLKKEGEYTKVQKLGGAGDKGRDICGYTQEEPIIYSWDLYQAKYYKQSYSPSLFTSDLAKFISCVYNDEYTCPRYYYICPLILGTSLFDLLNKPSDLKKWFLSEINKINGKFSNFSLDITPELIDYINKFDFRIFKPKNTSELLEIHERDTQNHWNLFGKLAKREQNPSVPLDIKEYEHIYIRELIKVYEEKMSQKDLTDEDIKKSYYKNHFSTQRKLFYCAEGLNLFSRDNLPGAFDALLNEVELGVASDVYSDHESSFVKLNSVLKTANTLNISNNPLQKRLQAGDLQGSCHHLVNNEKWKWKDE